MQSKVEIVKISLKNMELYVSQYYPQKLKMKALKVLSTLEEKFKRVYHEDFTQDWYKINDIKENLDLFLNEEVGYWPEYIEYLKNQEMKRVYAQVVGNKLLLESLGSLSISSDIQDNYSSYEHKIKKKAKEEVHRELLPPHLNGSQPFTSNRIIHEAREEVKQEEASDEEPEEDEESAKYNFLNHDSESIRYDSMMQYKEPVQYNQHAYYEEQPVYNEPKRYEKAYQYEEPVKYVEPINYVEPEPVKHVEPVKLVEPEKDEEPENYVVSNEHFDQLYYEVTGKIENINEKCWITLVLRYGKDMMFLMRFKDKKFPNLNRLDLNNVPACNTFVEKFLRKSFPKVIQTFSFNWDTKQLSNIDFYLKAIIKIAPRIKHTLHLCNFEINSEQLIAIFKAFNHVEWVWFNFCNLNVPKLLNLKDYLGDFYIQNLSFWGSGGQNYSDWSYHPNKFENIIDAIGQFEFPKLNFREISMHECGMDYEVVEAILKDNGLNSAKISNYKF